MALHVNGSSNPLGITGNVDRLPMHPYFIFKDLVTVFQQSVNYLKKGPASVKIDGVNASIRLITVDNKKVFVMDRGSNKPLDVKGITKSELEDRFGPGHGMIKIGGTVLDIFNKSMSKIKYWHWSTTRKSRSTTGLSINLWSRSGKPWA